MRYDKLQKNADAAWDDRGNIELGTTGPAREAVEPALDPDEKRPPAILPGAFFRDMLKRRGQPARIFRGNLSTSPRGPSAWFAARTFGLARHLLAGAEHLAGGRAGRARRLVDGADIARRTGKPHTTCESLCDVAAGAAPLLTAN